jgi:hypothetical protein
MHYTCPVEILSGIRKYVRGFDIGWSPSDGGVSGRRPNCLLELPQIQRGQGQEHR